MMNFLIAVMGDTFERVTEQAEVLAWKNKALRLLEVNAYCPAWLSGRGTPRFLLVCEAVNGTEPWSGFSGEIKREVKKLEEKVQAQLSDQQKSHENKQMSIENKLMSIENKLSEQQKALEKIANLLTSSHSQVEILYEA